MTERPWEGSADATWLITDLRQSQVWEWGLGWLSRPRDPFDQREIGEVTWSGDPEPKDQAQYFADTGEWLGRMRDQLTGGEEHRLLADNRWGDIFISSTSLRRDTKRLAVREIGLALFQRSPRPFDRREQNQVTWTCPHVTCREDALVKFTSWLGKLREQV